MRRKHFCHMTALASLIIINSCSPERPLKADPNIRGYVIGKELCNADETKDYWLIDFTYDPNPPQVGDTLTLNGIKYTNVLKTKQLHELLKLPGMKVSIDYTGISSTKIVTLGCSIQAPVTYPLKEIFIKSQGEIR